MSFYVNGTAGQAKYVNSGLWVANTPSDTEAFGLTYQQKHFDLGIFDKRVGSMWNDLSLANGSVANQVIPIDPFSVTNLYLNYVLRNGSHFDQTKFRLSVNNLFNHRGIVGDQQASNTAATYVPGNADQLTLLPGRSVALTVTLGFSLAKR